MLVYALFVLGHLDNRCEISIFFCQKQSHDPQNASTNVQDTKNSHRITSTAVQIAFIYEKNLMFVL
jgi:hypothetical protein